LVTKNDLSIFAVEFDGIDHFQDAQVIENDVIKNRLCKQASLPLLRITSSEIQESDQLTLLDYMLMRYISWQKEYPSIMEEISELVTTLSPSYDLDDLAIDLDPSFHFDLKHPFPARDIVVERLWKNHRISWDMTKPERHSAATYLCDVMLGGGGPSKNEQFHKCTRRTLVWPPSGSEHAPVFSEEISVSVRSWLPLQTQVPAPDLSRLFWSGSFESCTDQQAKEIINQFKTRVESMWFPDLPGMSAWDIAENYAEYLGFRAVERWAESVRRKDRLT
jgi:hypothetical protein